jgi:hypothetical protein
MIIALYKKLFLLPCLHKALELTPRKSNNTKARSSPNIARAVI